MCTRFTSTVMAARYRLAAMVTAALVLVLVMGPALAARSAVTAVSAPRAAVTFDIESISCASAGNCSAVGADP